MNLLQKSMKVVKDHFFILALLAMFVGFSAFKIISEEHASPQLMDELYWFELTGTDPYSPSSYQKLANQGSVETCDGETEICAIKAPELSPGSSMPAISNSPSDPLRAAIQDANDNQNFDTNHVVGLP